MTDDWVVRRGRVEEEREHRLEPPPGGAAAPPAAPASVGASPLRTPPPNTPAGWVPLGPSSVWFGQANRRPVISGRCRALVVSPDGQRAYAGSANGGTWYTDDAGLTWLPIDAFANTGSLTGPLSFATALAIGSLHVAFDPAGNAANDLVFVGTGEGIHFTNPANEPGHLGWMARGVGIRTATGPVAAVRAGGPAANPWTLEATNLANASIEALAMDPDGVVWAATSLGLYKRPAANRTTWTQVLAGHHSDVVVGGPEAGERYRVWAAAWGDTLRMAVDGGAFNPVTLPEFTGATKAWIDALVRRRLRLAAAPGSSVIYVLGSPNRLWRVSGPAPAAVQVPGLPQTLFGPSAGSDQSFYDMAITVHPTDPNTILVAGSYANDGTSPSPASIYRVTMSLVGGAWTIPALGTRGHTRVGEGVHSDVHALRWISNLGGGTDVWVGCDGGVYRSGSGADVGSFRGRNEGLATLEPGYIALDPNIDGVMIVGNQDNGVVTAEGPESWRLQRYGDGGGVAIDPADSRRRAAQYTSGNWTVTTDGNTWSDVRWWASNALNGAECGRAEFYSAPAVILAPNGYTQLAIGTQRIWYTESWGQNAVWSDRVARTWVTLPSGGAPSYVTDQVFDWFLVLRWGNADNLYAVTTKRVLHLRRVAGVWTQTVLWDKGPLATKKAKNWGAVIPPNQLVNDIVSHEVGRGSFGSVYAATGNPPQDDARLHVWWYDGTSRWLDCRLDVDAPAWSLATDPAHPEHIYVGTTVGVFRGTFAQVGGADPTWTWVRFSDGLPETPVADLAVHGPSRTLRAALGGRGVFEVELDAPPATPRRCYVRAFDGDLRRRVFPAGATTTIATVASRPVGANYQPVIWDASPDIRVRRAPGSAPPILRSRYTIPNTPTRSFWALQLKAAKLAAGATGVALGGGEENDGFLPLFPGGRVNPADWTRLLLDVPVTNRLPFQRDPTGQTPSPGEANVLIVDEPEPTGSASCHASTWASRVDVVVHTRGWNAVPAAGVSVALLLGPFAGRVATDLPADWAAALLADRTRPPLTRGAWLSGGWSYVDGGTPIRPLPGAIDGREAGVVTFDAFLPAGDHLLVAVVLNDDDAVASAVRAPFEVARQVHQVACRSVHVDAEPDVGEHLFREWHADQPTLAGYRTATGHASDARIVADPVNVLKPKAALHLDFLEIAALSFRVRLPPGTWYAWWEIVNPAGISEREHPGFTRVAYDGSGPAAQITDGSYAWTWDGRGRNNALVSAGTYRSRLHLKPGGGGAEYTFEASIDVVGDPYKVYVFGTPKPDVDLRAALTAAGAPFDNAGERITSDCWITVHRGSLLRTSRVFLGQGTIEATKAESDASAGAVATPHGHMYKGWIRVDPHGDPTRADRVQIEEIGQSNGQIPLDAGGGPLATNPYSVPPNNVWKDGVQAHAVTTARTNDDTSVGCTTVAETNGSCAAPGCTWDGMRSHDTTFGSTNLTVAGGGTVPPFLNKQRKRAVPTDALLVDTSTAPALAVPSTDLACGNPDEPLHFQPTFQGAVFGGMRHAEIPFTSNVADEPVNQLRIRLRLETYTAGSLYALYHHGAVIQHDRTDNGANVQLSCWRPRKVIRDWNNQRRNLLCSSARTRGNWTIRRVQTNGTRTTEATLLGTGETDWAQNLGVGHLTRTWTPGGALASGTWYSVVRYRIQLEPGAAADHAWVADAARADGLSNNAAQLLAEQIVEAGGSRWLEGESAVVIRVVP